MIKFVNLTPHEINVGTPFPEFAYPPSGKVARVSTSETEVSRSGTTDKPRCELVLVRQTTGATVDLPAPVLGTIYIVSGQVRTANPGRKDLASPGMLIRNEAGQPVGCDSLVLN